MDTEEPQKWRAAHKLHANFQLLRGISSPPQPPSCSVVNYNNIFLKKKKKFYWHISEWVKLLSCVQLFVTLWTRAHQAPQSMGFSRQDYRGGLPFPSPGDLPDPGIEPRFPTLQADALTCEPRGWFTIVAFYNFLKISLHWWFPWWSSGWESIFQCKECRFDLWSGNKDPTSHRPTKAHGCCN